MLAYPTSLTAETFVIIAVVVILAVYASIFDIEVDMIAAGFELVPSAGVARTVGIVFALMTDATLRIGALFVYAFYKSPLMSAVAAFSSINSIFYTHCDRFQPVFRIYFQQVEI